jgi:class 3 adenylate cyclase
MGDGYLVAGGIPAPLPDALARAAELAMDLMASSKVKLRIGIHVGPVVAGVIDQKLPFYDVWGSTVNLASRMESTAEPGRIQVTQAVKDRLPDYRFSERGDVDVKGHGKMNTWYLEGRPPTV